MNKDKLKGLLWGSFLGDAYASNNKLSLYGKQMLWLLEYMNESKVYDPFAFGDIWKRKMSQEEGHIDKASSDTLANLKSGRTYLGAGSGSHDLSVVGRHAPIMYMLKGMDEMLESVKFHTCLTHMSKEAIDTSKYIAEVTLAMIYNLDIPNTLQERAKFYGKEVEAEVAKGFELKDKPRKTVLRELGTGSDIEGALALTVYLLLNHHDNFTTLMEENLKAGGDASARAMVAGMIVGARYGFEAIRPIWIEELSDYQILKKLID
jgi:ADP-ribosylglycohydrolase